MQDRKLLGASRKARADLEVGIALSDILGNVKGLCVFEGWFDRDTSAAKGMIAYFVVIPSHSISESEMYEVFVGQMPDSEFPARPVTGLYDEQAEYIKICKKEANRQPDISGICRTAFGKPNTLPRDIHLFFSSRLSSRAQTTFNEHSSEQ